ncbi:MAG: TSUP family transporter [Nitriliruptorales bacterium]|nr:TSUP family transporter [Nitriliruptorales bacterium]
METWVALAAGLLAGAVSGLSGFGYALVSVPLLLLVFDPTTVIVALSFAGILINALVVLDSWRELDAGIVLSLLPWSAIGLVGGTQVLRIAEPIHIELAAGILVVAFAAALWKGVRLPGAQGRWGTVVAGASTGVMATSTGLGGPPIVMLFAARNLARDSFRASSAGYFLALAAITLSLLFARGMVETSHAPVTALLIPTAFAGKAVGTKIAKELESSTFRRVALGIILLSGTAGMATSGWQLLQQLL